MRKFSLAFSCKKRKKKKEEKKEIAGKRKNSFQTSSFSRFVFVFFNDRKFAFSVLVKQDYQNGFSLESKMHIYICAFFILSELCTHIYDHSENRFLCFEIFIILTM